MIPTTLYREEVELARGHALRSQDQLALFFAELRLAPAVIRNVSFGGTLFAPLNGCIAICDLEQHGMINHVVNPTPLSYVWGDLEVFRTGRPVATNVILVPGPLASPSISEVVRYVREFENSLFPAISP